MSLYYSQPSLILPEIDSDPAIIKVIHDGEKLERETYRKELMKLLKIQPSPSTEFNETTNSILDHQINPTSPGTSQIWTKRTVPVTPNSNFRHRQHYRSAYHQRSLNSSGDSSINRSLIESPRSGNTSFMKSTRSETNLSSPLSSNNKTSPMQNNRNISLTPSGTLVVDYRQSTAMKRIVNP